MRRLVLLLCLFALPALAEVPSVVTDLGPVQSLVSDVMGDVGKPTMLLPSGADPHDFQLRPSQARTLASADLVFWIGPDLIPALGDALTSLAPEARIVTLLHDSGRTRRFTDGGLDPHAWLDPVNAMAWLETIATELADRDPANAARYRANAARSLSELKALDLELATLLAPVKSRPFVTQHDALGYFTDRYGLAVLGAVALGDASSPSAAHLARISQILRKTTAPCVFPEAGRDPKFIAALTEGSDLRLGAPLDIEFITLDPGPGQYAVLLRNLATGLVDCLAAPP